MSAKSERQPYEQEDEEEEELLDDKRIEKIARSYNTAFKGIGTDEPRIIRETVALTNRQRQQVEKRYLGLFGLELEEHFKKELSGEFLKTMLALYMRPEEYEAKCVEDALIMPGKDETECIKLLCTKDNHELKLLKDTYKQIYRKDILNEMKDEHSGNMRKIFLSLLSGARPDNHGFEQDDVADEAQELYDAGQGKNFGTDDSTFIRILCSRSFPQLNAIFGHYNTISGDTDIETAIADEMSGSLKLACLTLVRSIRDRLKYFAEEIHNAFETNNNHDIIRLLVSRSNYDLESIKAKHYELYNQSIHDFAKQTLKDSDYKKLLLGLIGK